MVSLPGITRRSVDDPDALRFNQPLVQGVIDSTRSFLGEDVVQGLFYFPYLIAFVSLFLFFSVVHSAFARDDQR